MAEKYTAAEVVDLIASLREDSSCLDSSDSEIKELSCGDACAGAAEGGTFDSERYLSSSEHGSSVASESCDMECDVNEISSEEQESECFDESVQEFCSHENDIFSFSASLPCDKGNESSDLSDYEYVPCDKGNESSDLSDYEYGVSRSRRSRGRCGEGGSVCYRSNVRQTTSNEEISDQERSKSENELKEVEGVAEQTEVVEVGVAEQTEVVEVGVDNKILAQRRVEVIAEGVIEQVEPEGVGSEDVVVGEILQVA